MPSSFFVNNGGTTAARSTIADDLTASSNSKSDAQKLAINAEDAQFTLSDGTTTGNSALHYSAKAAASATSASGSASTATQQAVIANDAKLAAQTAKAEAVVAFGDSVHLTGDQTIAGAKTFSGAFTSNGIDDDASSTVITIDAAQNVGIGLAPSSWWSGMKAVETQATSGGVFASASVNGHFLTNAYYDGTNWKYKNNGLASYYYHTDGTHQFSTAASGSADANLSWSEAMRIDSSGNLLVGRTSTTDSNVGGMIRPDGFVQSTRDGNIAADFNRNTSDGDIVRFSKGSSPVGSIGVNPSGSFIINGTGNGYTEFRSNETTICALFSGGFYPVPDNSKDLGTVNYRWDDIYATNGTIQTSDRNEKQDIEELSEAEQRVAVACKGLLRKFRWKSSVEENGAEARIHFGIIAQDLQAAFEAEGLDAGRYAMFISSTWWETQTDVPAVEAVDEVLDEDGNVVTEAVEANEAYTRTDTYETLEKAPEGATERTRLGVRYSELLAFIISAI